MAKKGMTIYVPPYYVERRVKEFAYCVRDKINSAAGYERLHLHRYDQLEDGDVLIQMFDMDAGALLYKKYNYERDTVDDVVCALLRGEVTDVTEEYNAVEETIAPEDR